MSELNITKFDALFNATKRELTAGRLEKTKRRNKTAIDDAINSAIEQIEDAEDNINKATEVVASGGVIDPQVIVDEYAKIGDCKSTIKQLKAFKKEFFGEVVIKGKGRTRKVIAKQKKETTSAM